MTENLLQKKNATPAARRCRFRFSAKNTLISVFLAPSIAALLAFLLGFADMGMLGGGIGVLIGVSAGHIYPPLYYD